MDVDQIRRRLLALTVNDDVARMQADQLGLSPFTVGAVLRDLSRMKLLTVHELNDGSFAISGVSPLARRQLSE